jgi:hypothetical protein
MAKIKLSDKLYMYAVDEQHIQPVLEFLQAQGRDKTRATKTFYNSYMIVFNKEHDHDLAVLFLLKFNEIAKPVMMDYEIDDGTGNDEGANYGPW